MQLFGLVRVLLSRDDASVAAVSDLAYFCAVGIFLMVGLNSESIVLLDVASLAALVGILATGDEVKVLLREHGAMLTLQEECRDGNVAAIVTLHDGGADVEAKDEVCSFCQRLVS